MKIALIQNDNSCDIAQNIAKIMDIVSRRRADYYVFPESFITGYSSNRDNIKTITLDDVRLEQIRTMAVEQNCHIFVGANIACAERRYIGYLHIHQKIDVYYKTHLGIKEESLFDSGAALKVFDGIVPTGVSICIESHFGDIAQSLRLRGAEILLVPFASPKVCGGRQKLWRKYLPARAYDNQMFLFATNLTGLANGLVFSGGMMAVDPRGNIIYEHYDDAEHVAIVEIDESAVAAARARSKINYIDRRRPELYGG